ncbi:hypothetical protein DFH08DRAFT_883090 [Mycena albidolilacea]|uniref:F-box domain-containing protein n=1 Tax=Mycena albidolilacea TaxID=1033008 RepID=A0AAD7EIP1_9AGAR|nr:hypothetical protein DFH08DRAFT_883090 [Mycena albidolilacea]
MDPASALPAELWLYIHRLATSATSPMVVASADRYRYDPVTDPLTDIEHFWRQVSSFVRVCRLWNDLANELLYENIRVDDQFDALCTALQNPVNADLVRSVRLSPTHIEHNYAVLALCPRLQVIVHPDLTAHDLVLPGVDDPVLTLASHSVKHIYWSHSHINSTLLLELTAAATPSLESLCITNSTVSTLLRSDQETRPFPATNAPNLQRLGMVGVPPRLAQSILALDLRNLTRLKCSPSLFAISDSGSPVKFPSLRVLELFGSRRAIPFAAIFARCPRLRELCYDVWNSILSPEGERSKTLSCMRLHSAVTVVRDWAPIQSHFALFISPEFPSLQRLVLDNSWYRVIDDPLFVPFRDELKARGCRLEFPEGYVR